MLDRFQEIARSFAGHQQEILKRRQQALKPVITVVDARTRIERLMEERHWILPVGTPIQDPSALVSVIGASLELTHKRLDALTRPLAATVQGLQLTLDDHPSSILHESGLFRRHRTFTLTSEYDNYLWFADFEYRKSGLVDTAAFVLASLSDASVVQREGFEKSFSRFGQDSETTSPGYTPSMPHIPKKYLDGLNYRETFSDLRGAVYLELDDSTGFQSIKSVFAYPDGLGKWEDVIYPIAPKANSRGVYTASRAILTHTAVGYQTYQFRGISYKVGRDGLFRRELGKEETPTVEEEVVEVLKRLPFSDEHYSEEALRKLIAG